MYTKDQLVNVFNYPAALAGHYSQIANLEDWTEDEIVFVSKLLNKTIAAIGEDHAKLAFGLTSAIYDGQGGSYTASMLDPDNGIWPDTRPEIATARQWFDRLRKSGEEARFDAIKNCRLLPDSYSEARQKAVARYRRPLKD